MNPQDESYVAASPLPPGSQVEIGESLPIYSAPPPPLGNDSSGTAPEKPFGSSAVEGTVRIETSDSVPLSRKKILGLPRRPLFIAVAVFIFLLVAGLAAGLGVALSKRGSQAQAQTIPSESSSSTRSDYTADTSTSGYTTTPTTSSLTSGPSPTIFQLSPGTKLFAVSLSSSQGNLCTLVKTGYSETTTLYPTIEGSNPSGYTANWVFSTNTNIATLDYPATAGFRGWIFETETEGNEYDCALSGFQKILFGEDSLAVMITYVELIRECRWGFESIKYDAETFCQIYWIGSYSDGLAGGLLEPHHTGLE